MRKNYLFTSESVSEGHPDKVCDSISDTLLDLFLTHDPQARSAVETMATTDRVIICGEARLPENVDKRMMEDAIRRIGEKNAESAEKLRTAVQALVKRWAV